MVITEQRRPGSDRDRPGCWRWPWAAAGANRSDPVRGIMTSPVDTIGHREGIFSARSSTCASAACGGCRSWTMPGSWPGW